MQFLYNFSTIQGPLTLNNIYTDMVFIMFYFVAKIITEKNKFRTIVFFELLLA